MNSADSRCNFECWSFKACLYRIHAFSDNVLGFSVIIGSKTIRATEQDLNRYSEIPMDDFDVVLDDANWLLYFTELAAQLNKGTLQRRCTTICCRRNETCFSTFWLIAFPIRQVAIMASTKWLRKLVCSFSEHSYELEKMIMKNFLKNQAAHNNKCLYPKFLQLVLNRMLTIEELATYPSDNIRYLVSLTSPMIVYL